MEINFYKVFNIEIMIKFKLYYNIKCLFKYVNVILRVSWSIKLKDEFTIKYFLIECAECIELDC